MGNLKFTIGRDPKCDYVIFDPKNRVSRKHAEICVKNNKMFITDTNSTNGVFVNGKRIQPNSETEISIKDKLTLSIDYAVDLLHFAPQDDKTRVLNQNLDNEKMVKMENGKGVYNDGKKTVVFDTDKTQIGEMLQMDNSPFVTIGRNPDNKIVINDVNISRYHCKIRLLTPLIIEVEDLESSNGTFADDEKIAIGSRHQFSSSVKIRFGKTFFLDLKKVFPNIQIIQKQISPTSQVPPPGAPITPHELASFTELELLWKEYLDRQNRANNVSMGYSIGGSILALAFGSLTGGAGLLITTGGGILGRYLGNQASSKIKNDLTYEDAFLQTYACPRCKESFQKRPWITIRECFKCKIKFR
jgi:pSer/pThr/pTyr-binding forkhead associated (FHA) protein/ribosomal protein L37AE/L43A